MTAPKIPLCSMLSAVLVAGALTGCSPQAEQAAESPQPTTVTEPAVGNAPAGAPAGPDGPAGTLGTQQKATPYLVTLSSAPLPPTLGETEFTATVSRDDKPVTNATVVLNFTMPAMENVEIPQVPLQPIGTEGNTYRGTANLSVEGEYQAELVVKEGDLAGNAVYVFVAG